METSRIFLLKVFILELFLSLVSTFFYYFLISIKQKHDPQTLEIDILIQINFGNFLSYQGLSLVIGKYTFLFLTKHYTTLALMDFDGM